MKNTYIIYLDTEITDTESSALISKIEDYEGVDRIESIKGEFNKKQQSILSKLSLLKTITNDIINEI